MLLLLGMAHAVAAAAKPLEEATAGCRYGEITADADGPPPCHPQARPNPYVDSPAVSVVIQTFKDGSLNAMQLVQRLRPIPLTKDIIVNDDSHGGQSGIWLKLLTGANEFYISSQSARDARLQPTVALRAWGAGRLRPRRLLSTIIAAVADGCSPTLSIASQPCHAQRASWLRHCPYP